jgi:type II restriction enzyme
MAKKQQLRKTRTGTIINVTSKKQETEVYQALQLVVEALESNHRVQLVHEPYWFLRDIVANLRTNFPEIDFFYHFNTSNIRPDGGILSILGKNSIRYPILISEVKNQGTNDLRLQEGLPKQAMGNAIERLGKNVIGFRTALMHESIFPFVCFGYGYDFSEGSSILDRVVTIAMFGKLNTLYLHNLGEAGGFNRGSFYFRRERWSIQEMREIMYDIAERSVYYYYSKYGKDNF